MQFYSQYTSNHVPENGSYHTKMDYNLFNLLDNAL